MYLLLCFKPSSSPELLLYLSSHLGRPSHLLALAFQTSPCILPLVLTNLLLNLLALEISTFLADSCFHSFSHFLFFSGANFFLFRASNTHKNPTQAVSLKIFGNRFTNPAQSRAFGVCGYPDVPTFSRGPQPLCLAYPQDVDEVRVLPSHLPQNLF